MRKKIVAGNWKMNLTLAQGEQLINDILQAGLKLGEGQEVVVATPFPYLTKAKSLLKNYPGFFVAAQNCASEKSGAYTGEVSAEMLQSVGVDYVIIGHSERREYFQESNAILAKKIDLALAADIKPIFCCGEPLEVRQAETQNAFVAKQLEESLFHLTEEQLATIAAKSNNFLFVVRDVAFAPLGSIRLHPCSSVSKTELSPRGRRCQRTPNKSSMVN